MASINDIAREAGVSKWTVARVLKGAEFKRPTAAKRAEQIRKIAERLKYRPNSYAKAVSTGRFKSVTLLMSEDYRRSPLPKLTLYGLQRAAVEAGYMINLNLVSDEQLADPDCVPSSLGEWHSDGVLINYHKRLHRRLLEVVDHFSIPAIWLNFDADHDCVCPDDMGAGRAATQRLLDLGHRRIWYVGYSYRPDRAHFSEIDRRAGYESAMGDAGLASVVVDQSHPLLGDYLERGDAWIEVLRDRDRPTAVVCYGRVAVSIVQGNAISAGLRIPDDLSLVTFGGESLFNMLPLDTWLVPEAGIGETGLRMLLQKISNPSQTLCGQSLAFTHSSGRSVAKCGG